MGSRTGTMRKGKPCRSSAARRPRGGTRTLRRRSGEAIQGALQGPRTELPQVGDRSRTALPRPTTQGRGGSGAAGRPARCRQERPQASSRRSSGGQPASRHGQGPPTRRRSRPCGGAEPGRGRSAAASQHPLPDAVPRAPGRPARHVSGPGRVMRPKRLQRPDGRRKEPAGRVNQLKLLLELQRVPVHAIELLDGF